MSGFDTTGIPEGKKGTSEQWLDSVVHDSIGVLQVDLSKEERAKLVEELAILFHAYEKLVLGMVAVREMLYCRWNLLIRTGLSESRLSRNYNTAVKGQNEIVRAHLSAAFKEAWGHEQAGRQEAARIALQRAELSHRVLFGPEIISFVEMNNPRADAKLTRTREIKDQLFHSIIKLSISVAKEHSLKLRGIRVECSDLAQEAYIAAMQAVEAYHPIGSGETFTTFTRNWISGVLSKRMSETTRTVAIPRSLIDRFDAVGKAIDLLELDVADLRGGICQNSLLVEGRVDYETLRRIAYTATAIHSEDRTSSKPYTPEEVMDLLIVTQDTFSLEMQIESQGISDGQEYVTLGETLTDESPSVEDQIDGALVGKRLLKIIRRFTTSAEYDIMRLRYGLDEVIGYDRLSDLYCAGTGKPMNKAKARMIDLAVLARVKEAAKRLPGLKQQLQEITETLPYAEKN